MGKKLIFALAIILMAASSSFAADEAKTPSQQKKEEKPKREPVVDTFTRIDEGVGGIDALVIYGHPLYFVYKGVLEDAKKKYDMERFHVFIVTINSQKKLDLSKFKIEESIFIRTEEGTEYPAARQWIPISETPSKRTGLIRFFKVDANGNKVLKDDAKSLEIVIKSLGNVPERNFKWKLPIEF